MIMPISFNLSTSDFPDWSGASVEDSAIQAYEHGCNLLAANDYLQAKSAYQIAIECNPKLAIAYGGISRAEYQLGNYQAALVAINIAIDSEAQIEFYYQRAIITKALNDHDRVVADAHQTIELSPLDLTEQGVKEIESVKIETDRLALANLDLHIEQHPQDPYGYCYRGMCHDRIEHYLLALADFDRAISIQPNESLFHQARGRTYCAVGNFAAALADYDLVIQLQPRLASVYVDRSEIHYLSGDCQQALADCDRAIGLNPQLIAAYFQRGIALAELGQIDEALADYTQIIALDPQQLGAYLRRSWIYFRRGDYPSAIADCEFVLSFDRDSIHAHYLLGVIHTLTGCKIQAIIAFTRSIELEPNYIAALYHRGIIYHEFSNLAQASDDFDRARSIQNHQLAQLIDLDETSLYAEGLALYYTGQLEPARTMLNLAALFAKRFDNASFHEQISLVMNRQFSR